MSDASHGRRVLVTGIAGALAGLVARALEARDDVELIVGVDVREPQHRLARTAFVHADIRNPLVAERLRDERIDTVVHLSISSTPDVAGGRARMKERNVISTMQLLAACRTLPDLERLVLRSSTAVYGSDHRDPTLVREDDAPRRPVEHGFAKDMTEVEAYVRSFAAGRPDVDVTVLRFANLVGANVGGSIHALFTLPVVPSIAGYDPRLQFCHEDDAVEVLTRVVTGAHPGTYNVAGPGVLYLSQCVRIAGHLQVPVPSPFVDGLASLLRRAGRSDVSADQLRFLQFGRTVDTTRLTDELGVEPRHTTRSAFEDLVARRRIKGLVDRDEVVRLVDEAGMLVERARRAARRATTRGDAGGAPCEGERVDA